MPLGPAMKQELPGVKNYVRMQEGWRGSFVKSGDQIIQVPVSFADPEFFTVFSFPLRYGSATSVLKDLHDVVLTQKTAEKLFGNVNPVGKTIQIKTETDYEPFVVAGVSENIPSNSSISFDILGNYNYIATTNGGARNVNNWNRSSFLTYLQLEPGSSIQHEHKR